MKFLLDHSAPILPLPEKATLFDAAQDSQEFSGFPVCSETAELQIPLCYEL